MGGSSDDDELPHLYVRMMEHSDSPQGKRPTFTPNIATVEGKQVKFIVSFPNEVQDLMRHFLPLISEQMRGTDVFGAVEEMSRGTGTVWDPLNTQWNGNDLKGIMVKAHTLTSTDGTPFGVFVLLQNDKQGANYRVCVVSPSADFHPNQLSSAWESYRSEVALSQKTTFATMGTKQASTVQGGAPAGSVLPAPNVTTHSINVTKKPSNCTLLARGNEKSPGTGRPGNHRVRRSPYWIKRLEQMSHTPISEQAEGHLAAAAMDDDKNAPPAVGIVVDDQAVLPSHLDGSRGTAGLWGGGGMY
jgi:hypothetical protein